MFPPAWFTYFGQYFIKSRLFNQRTPLLAGFKITYNCNLTCKHCPFWKRPKPEALKFDQVKNILHKFYKMGARILILEGGEPLLWQDGDYTISDVVKYAQKLFFSIGMTTNGTLPLNVPVNTVWVSLDGLDKTHNLIRNRDIFNTVIKNIEESAHPNIYANITINNINYKEVPDLARFLKNKVKGITIQFEYPFDKPDNLVLTKEERIWVLRELINLKRKGHLIANSYAALDALKENRWRCHDWMLANADPDGKINFGCYVRNRGDISCKDCGFAAHTEISLAYDLTLEAIFTGRKIFRYGEKGE